MQCEIFDDFPHRVQESINKWLTTKPNINIVNVVQCPRPAGESDSYKTYGASIVVTIFYNENK